MIDPNAVHLVVSWDGAGTASDRILGLWRVKAWASLLGCVSAAIYLPFDIYAIIHHPGWPSWSVLAINLLVVAVLTRDLIRRRYASALH